MPRTRATASPTPTTTPTPAPSATPTPAPTPPLVNGRITVSNLDDNGAAVVAGILYPASGGVCGANGKYDSCPVTDGLAQRLDSNPLKGAEPLCRCGTPTSLEPSALPRCRRATPARPPTSTSISVGGRSSDWT